MSVTTDRKSVCEGMAAQPGIEIIYDGECPFCSAYVRMVKLKDAVGPVMLVDARDDPATVAKFREAGIDLNLTMAVNYGGRTYAGAEAIELLSLLSSNVGLMNRLLARILHSKRRATLLYPWLRRGRNLTLKILGRQKLGVF